MSNHEGYRYCDPSGNDDEEATIDSVSIPTHTISFPVGTNVGLARKLSITDVEIALDDAEDILFQTLVATAKAYNMGELGLPVDDLTVNCGADSRASPSCDDDSNGKEISKPPQPLCFRIAGGWVRDKLLQLQTHDVDVAVNILNGTKAAQLVQQYLRLQGKPAGKIGVIAANPAQSKHLETATMRIGDIEVDFCNLRGAEVYQDHSRIPTVAFGTPLQDAMRRDFTLNALFYNLTTGQVEDWTRRGFQDLRAGRLVTPLEPVNTFLDDPLRVLRAIRFAVRYEFTLDPAIELAAKRPDIHRALHVKVSRERVGKELEAMLWAGKGANPVLALQIISRLQLAGSVFCLPVVGQGKVTSMKGFIGDNEYYDTDHEGARARHIREVGWELALQHLEIFVKVLQAHQQLARKVTTSSTYDTRLSALASYLLPFRKLLFKEGKKEREFLAVSYIFRDGIKFKNLDVQFITRLMENVDDMAAFLTRTAASSNDNNKSGASAINRLEAGLVLQSAKELWVTALLLATVILIHQQEKEGKLADSIDWIRVCGEVYQRIVEMNLDRCWEMKPFLDGKALIQALNLPQGPIVGTYRDEQLRWMLQNPDGSREDCEAHLHSFKRKLEDGAGDIDGLGVSDGAGKTLTSGNHEVLAEDHPHFSKKMHVESMDLKE